MTDITQEKYENLQKQCDELRVQFKRQKQRIRKINRTKYNQQRKEAANSDIVKELRQKSRQHINELNSKVTKQKQEIEELQEECADWRQDRNYTYQKYLASFSFAICSTIGWYFTLRGIENCVCE